MHGKTRSSGSSPYAGRRALLAPGTLTAVLAAAVLWQACEVVTAAEPALPAGLEEPALPRGLPTDSTDNEPALPGGLPATPKADEPALPSGLPATPKGDEPALPDGLPSTPKADEPALPGGLPTTPKGSEPTLPAGLPGQGAGKAKPGAGRETKPRWLDPKSLGLSGFLEVRGGVRTQPDRHEEDASLGETRLQLDWEKTYHKITFKLVADLLYDVVDDHHSVNLNTGDGFLDLRQANVLFSPTDFMDVKVGRQILTWGTGDLLFINDLFPKDWRSFLSGRDTEYLKAPSDAMKASFFTDLANLDVVFVPQFDPDRYIRGRRISYYNPLTGGRAGQNAVIHADTPDDCFDDTEWHARVYRKVKGVELAAYGYWGYWKSPLGVNPATGRATFPRLSVYGASARGLIAKGVASMEAGYYHSRQDESGTNPFIPNSQVRFLLGYERCMPELAQDLTLAMQYYFEYMMDYGAYRRNLPVGMPADSEMRNLLTFHITKRYLKQTLTIGLFAFYSPTDDDAYLRPNIQYKIDDHWTVELGGNVFIGTRNHTFFGQFSRDSSIYCSLRYGF